MLATFVYLLSSSQLRHSICQAPVLQRDTPAAAMMVVWETPGPASVTPPASSLGTAVLTCTRSATRSKVRAKASYSYIEPRGR